MSAMPPSAKTTPCSERARKQRDHPRNRRHHPQQTQAAQTLQQLPTMPTSASRSCTQSQDQADRASLPDRNCKLSSPATKTSRSPRIRRPIAPRTVTARQQISKSQPQTRRPAPRSGLRSHHINKHGITLANGATDLGRIFGQLFELAMQIEREQHLKAGHRTPERQGYANGYKRIDTPLLPFRCQTVTGTTRSIPSRLNAASDLLAPWP